MGYIGVQPTDTYLSIASQQITGNGGATYTLDYSVSNEEDVAVFVNNVRQNVSTYTVSGTSLTLGGTISASDSCWVLFLGRTVGTKTPAVGSVTNDMLAGSIANAKLANSSINLNGSAVSLGGSASVANTPAFLAHCATTNPSVPSGTTTKIVFDAEEYDSDNCYDTSTGRFTPTVAGKYLFLTCIEWGSGSNGVLIMQLYKNGSLVRKIIHNDVRTLSGSGGSIIDMNGTTDYVELYVYQGSGTTWVADASSSRTWFQGFRLIGA